MGKLLLFHTEMISAYTLGECVSKGRVSKRYALYMTSRSMPLTLTLPAKIQEAGSCNWQVCVIAQSPMVMIDAWPVSWDFEIMYHRSDDKTLHLKKVKCSGEHKNIYCCQCKIAGDVSYKVQLEEHLCKLTCRYKIWLISYKKWKC